MTYTYDDTRRATAYRTGRYGYPLTMIVIHWWGDPASNPQFDDVVSYFQRGGNNTSAHYVVEAGRVAQMVNDSDTSFAAGNWQANLKSINIECNPRASDADKATIAELVLHLLSVHGNLDLVGHRDVSDKFTDCPGVYYPPKVTLAPWLNTIAPPTIPTISTKDEDMSGFFKLKQDNSTPETAAATGMVYLSNGITAVHVPNEVTLADMHFLGYQGMYRIVDPISDYEVINGVPVRTVRDLTIIGKILS